MAGIQIPLDMLTSRLNLSERFSGLNKAGVMSRFSNLRPVSEFCDFKRLSKPENFHEVQSRVNYNLSYFSSNYSVMFVMLCIYTLLTNWFLLFDIIFVTVGLFIIGKLDGRDLEIGTFRASPSQCYTGLLVIAIPIGLLSSPFSTIAWLIGASGVTILGHAAMMDKPIDEAFSGEANPAGAAWGGGEDGGRVEELDSGLDEDGAYAVGFPNSSSSLVRRSGYMGDEDDGEEPEEVIVERAMARIREAKSQGRGDVDLTPTEVAALQRMQERKKKEAERRRLAEKRVSIPLASFELDDDELPEHPPPGALDGRAERQAYPPVGYFPPPSAVQSQPRKRSGTSSHRGRRGEDEMYMLPAASAPSLDPDYYMSNAGPHAPPGAVVAAHRTFSGPQPRSRRHGDSSDEYSGDETASDEYRDGGARGRRDAAIIAEAAAGDRSKTPDLRRSSRRNASKSPAKRSKPAAAEKDKGKTASATSTKSRKKR
ncbi:hypothetical protein RB595_009148 [Gaeumannomyces hyphopodioides]